MIRYVKGNLLDAKTQALVNTVNTVGVMGKGIALQFKKRFPKNFKQYLEACKNGTLTVGKLLIVQEGDLLNQRLIINFPTKQHWKTDSEYEYIELGLDELKREIIHHKISSIAIPPLGCGNGGLDFNQVKGLIETKLKGLDCDIIVYTPNEEIGAILLKEMAKPQVKLTPARAMLLYLLFQYEARGEQSSLFAANKIAYFLQRSGENMRLKFEAWHYGPYAVQVNHVLLALNGLYLRGLEQNTAKPFEPLLLEYNRYEEVKSYIEKELSTEQKQRLASVLRLLEGFESTFSLELMASIDFITANNANIHSTNQIMHEISNWNDRKKKLFQVQQVEVTWKHLQAYSNNIFEMV